MNHSNTANAAAAAIPPASFEAAMAELELIVRDLESGKTPLDESLAKYQRGCFLQNFCEAKLREAQLTVEKISIGADGQPISSVVDLT